VKRASRPTPWDVVFADDRFDKDSFPAIEQEARERGIDPATPDRFLLLSSVGNLLHELAPDAGGEQPADRPPLDSVRLFGPLVFQAFHFQRHGHTVLDLDENEARKIMGSAEPIGGWPFRTPAQAGYLHLPRNLLWARVTDEVPAEPADGFFWTMIDTAARGSKHANERDVDRLDSDAIVGDVRAGREPRLPASVALLLVLGLREDRAGFTVVDAIASPPDPPGHWGDTNARGEGEDFANVLPGGELSHLHGIVNVAELFKLASRAFHHAARKSGP
jgi:hypothetical protein